MTKLLKTGDTCPCCGEPIKTKDPDTLLLLSLIRDNIKYRAAVADAIAEIRETDTDDERKSLQR